MGTGPRHAEGGGEGFRPAAEDLVLAGDDGHGAIRVITEDHLHVAAGQVREIAVAGDEVDAAFHLGERHDPGRTKTVRRGRRLALVIPTGVEAALRGRVAGVVVPQVQAVAGERAGDTARRAGLGIHQGDDRFVGAGRQQFGRGLDVGKTSDGLILRGRSRRTVVVTA